MRKSQSPSGESVFQIISDPSEKMKIIYDLIKSRQNMVVKSTDAKSEMFKLEPRNIQGSVLKARPLTPGPLPIPSKNNELILQFQVGEQKYITQVPFEPAGDQLNLSMERKLFRVQRREFFRLHLPANFRGHLTIESIGGIPFHQKLALIDLSGGGCRARTKSTDLPAGIGFEAKLEIPGREEFKFKCTIRHRGLVMDRSGDHWLGIQFSHATEKDSSRMAATVMDLYREYFSRL